MYFEMYGYHNNVIFQRVLWGVSVVGVDCEPIRGKTVGIGFA
jgi:hypothetical protein